MQATYDNNGILIIDKPQGMTSHDVVDCVRRKLGIKKVGHCGTLDPIATGVLVILLGKATKLSSKFSADEKEYICKMALGSSTDTHDISGRVLKTGSTAHITEGLISQAIYSFVGRQKQIPPMVSAKQHNGTRLYKLARKGIEIERKPVDIEIKEIDVMNALGSDIEFRILCSKGTYVRTLCNDIGEKLGCGAHMKALRRIRSGRFCINDAVGLDKLNTEGGIIENGAVA